MSVLPCLRFLQPFTQRDLPASRKAAYLGFYSIARGFGTSADVDLSLEGRTETIKKRVRELHTENSLKYPRISHDVRAKTCNAFKEEYSFLKINETKDSDVVTLRGRVHHYRVLGSKLVFLDVVQDGRKVQVVCNFGKLGCSDFAFAQFVRLLKRGDIISATGTPFRAKVGELSLQTMSLPHIITPALASLPSTLDDPETRIRNRHADMLVNQKVADTLRLRSHIIQYLRNFLVGDGFLEFQTPILADSAGGAMARPFLTTATEFSEKELSMRIAPEIWLKRLILGGMDRVFEIGPSFRNEGLDATHNPEFTTCEFYKSFTELEELISMTETLLEGLAKYVNDLIAKDLNALSSLQLDTFKTPFNRVEFIPALEEKLGRQLPDLEAEDATQQVTSLFYDFSIPIPSSPTLPRLLDRLSAIYLEPGCTGPTFIIHHPACLAPLAKSFLDPETNQLVSARVELFIHNREIANMYEEENSPFEQKRKFIQQGLWRDNENQAVFDENYLEALEWGLPPTGGWGCGIDRLCMLLSGSSRISDVLAFGSLKNVVGLGQDSRKASQSEKEMLQ